MPPTNAVPLLPQRPGLGVFLGGGRLLPGGCQLLRRKHLLRKQYYLQVSSVARTHPSPHLVHLGYTALPARHRPGAHGWPGAPCPSASPVPATPWVGLVTVAMPMLTSLSPAGCRADTGFHFTSPPRTPAGLSTQQASSVTVHVLTGRRAILAKLPSGCCSRVVSTAPGFSIPVSGCFW